MSEAVAGESAPLREAVLAGRYFGTRFAAAAERVAAFLVAGRGEALLAWFGAAAGVGLIGDEAARRALLDRDIAAIDAMIGAALDAILHHPRLRRLEGSWRGLAWLAEGVDPAARVKVKVLAAGWAEICRDLERAAEFDQSLMFRKIYEEEFGSPGGEPYGMLVVDHEVRPRPAPGFPTDDVSALAALAGVAAGSFAPLIIGAAPALLGVDEFADLATVADPAAALNGPEHLRWRGISAQEDVRFVGIVLPRFLARPPWADDPARGDGFRYRESAETVGERVWMNAAYGFASVVVRAMVHHGWPAEVRGADLDEVGGGVVTDLPHESADTDPPGVWTRPSPDVVLTDRQERSLVEAGLMPATALAFTDEAMWGAVRSLQNPQRFMGANARAANANARISAQINSMLCVSRFAHYLKVRGRDMVGSFRTAEEIERDLQKWIGGYVNTNVSAGFAQRSRFPLVGARITVKEKPGRPGVFGCVFHLQPHFQLDDVSATFRLVTDIAAPAAR